MMTHSTYFTFRVISTKSPSGSWIRKAVPANNVSKAIEDSLRGQIEDMVKQGLQEDLSFD